ncbi:MAG TPA: hypothetical protein VEG68_10740 [Terriglobales bacterium]|nr:hypothetical protein [Terriglobales bacterium]
MKRKFASVMSVLSLILLALAPVVQAQTKGKPQVLHNPDVRYPIYFDVSPPLREMAKQSAPQPGLHLAPPVRTLPARPGQVHREDGARQTTTLPLVAATIGLNLLGVGNGFNGYSVPDAPTDVNLAVGDTQVVQWVNTSYAVFDKTTGAVIAGPIEGNTLWSGFGGNCQNDNSGDIVAQWDKIAHRWLLAQNAFTTPYLTCVAVSETNDATGAYYRFAYSQPGFPDYPKWGIMPDAYYQNQNNFGDGGAAYPCAYDRSKLLVGDSSAAQICFQQGANDFSLLPADLDSAGTLPPTGQQEVYLGSISSGTGTQVYEYLFHVDFTTPSNSTFTGTNLSMPITVAAYTLACGGDSPCIPQEGSSDDLDSLGDRLMYRLAYRNFSDHQSWLVSHAVDAGSSVGERWYEFQQTETPPTNFLLNVYQQGTFAPDSNYRWMGSLAMDSAQDIALGYSVSSSSMFPTVNFTGRVASDPLGTMESEVLIVAGTGSQVDTSNRWGDYTSMAIDEADDCTFWYTNQYYMTTTSFDWSTQLASLKFPGCGTTTPDFSLSPLPSTQTVNVGASATYTATATPVNSFSGTVSLTVTGCPSNATCTLNPTSVTLPPAQNSTLTVQTTSTTPTGTYTLTITGTSGSLVNTTSVTLVVVTPDFSISASPASQTVAVGGSLSYTAKLAALNGFSGTVGLTVTGCPSNTTCTLKPTSVPFPPGQNSTLTVQTTSTTPGGTYTLTITGTSGSLIHTASVTLVVKAPDFSITSGTSLLSIKPGATAKYGLTLTPLTGFKGSVTLTVSGLPSNSSGAFSVSPVTVTYPKASKSTLSVSTTTSVPAGTYTLTITGTSGTLTHSITVTLVVT